MDLPLYWFTLVLSCNCVSCCLFYLSKDLKADVLTVVQSHVVTSGGPACETLCLRYPRDCYAAHLVPLEDGAFLCEFVNVWTAGGNSSGQLVPNPGGRYIARSTGPPVKPETTTISLDISSHKQLSSEVIPPTQSPITGTTTLDHDTTTGNLAITDEETVSTKSTTTAAPLPGSSEHYSKPTTFYQRTSLGVDTTIANVARSTVENVITTAVDTSKRPDITTTRPDITTTRPDITTTQEITSEALTSPEVTTQPITTLQENTPTQTTSADFATTAITIATTMDHVTTTEPLITCPSGMARNDTVNKCFVLVTVSKEFAASLLHCKTAYHENSTLMEVRTDFDQALMRDLSDNRGIWLGAKRDTTPACPFRWLADNAEVTYVWDWAVNEPSNGCSSPCIRILGTTGQWRDTSCTITGSYICQYP